jgi:BirA family biotin operon repressor/biotin-[acetyl-CoA-carboxylase] ligase
LRLNEFIVEWCVENKISYNYWEVADSTNSIAKKNIQNFSDQNKNIRFDFAAEQTSGRGRGDHSWTSPGADQSFLWSWTLKSERPYSFVASPLIGWIVYQCCQNTWPERKFKIKPPNDIYMLDSTENKKIAGILIEGIQQGHEHYLIIGLGLNLLSSPAQISNSSYVYKEQSITEDILKQDINNFLNLFYRLLKESILKFHDPTLDSSTRTRIAKAIEALDVKPNFDIIYSDRIISWKDL